MTQEVSIEVRQGDATKHQTDVLTLKYAQANYGLDRVVSEILLKGGRHLSEIRPKPSEFSLVNSVYGIAAKHVLFVGVVNLYEFGYQEIREFSRTVLSALAELAPKTESVTLTLHGVNYGLDELEAFESEIAGIVDAVRSSNFPENLTEIVIIEHNRGRINRIKELLNVLIPDGKIQTNNTSQNQQKPEITERLRSAGYTSKSKEHVFVAMPFKDEMDDVYHYGIQGAVKAAGFLCERADLSAFTGDIMGWVRERIQSSKLIVADLTDANPNVYLEVGYAWGCGIPTVLLIGDYQDLKFDVRSQRCITYKKIKDLEESLTTELEELKELGRI